MTILAAVFVLGFAWFAFGAGRVGLASLYGDPVSRIPAQDDAVYAREAIEMAGSGNWLTPTYLGRYALNKPPMLQWLAALSVKVFGISAWALRLPSILAAVLTTSLVFAWVWRLDSWLSGASAAVLLASSHLFYEFSRIAMTDMLLTLWITSAIFVLARDPALYRHSTPVWFGIFSGVAILTKAAAGTIPLLVLVLSAALLPRRSRPQPRRVLAAFGVAAAVAFPWHAYQAAAHPRWFFQEYVLQQHLAIGVTAPPQYTNENHLIFYARRLFRMDPVLTILACAACFTVPWRKLSVLTAWLAVTLIALFGFRYRSAYYLLPLFPVLAVITAELLVRFRRLRVPLFTALLLSGLIKATIAAPVWGISAGRESHRPAAAALDRYCAKHRDNGLIFVGSDDQFYASALPLAHLRYAFFTDPARSGAPRPWMDFDWLGISVSVEEFNHLGAMQALFGRRLAEFNLPSSAPMATVIRIGSLSELARLIESHPDIDFWLPADLLRGLSVAIPQQVELTESGVFLLARHSGTFHPKWPCHL